MRPDATPPGGEQQLLKHTKHSRTLPALSKSASVDGKPRREKGKKRTACATPPPAAGPPAEKSKFGYVVQSGNNAWLVRNLLRKRKLWAPGIGDPGAPFGRIALAGNGLVVDEVPTYAGDVYLLWTAYRSQEWLDAIVGGSAVFVAMNSQKKFLLEPLRKVPPWRLHNHLDGNHVLCRKCELRDTLAAFFSARGLDPFGIHPPSYVIRAGDGDAEFERWRQRFGRELTERGERVWLVKPGAHSNQGRGIEVCDSVDSVQRMVATKEITWVLQKYIERPLLINGRKFDVRMYALIMQEPERGPFHAYFFNDGYVRTASAAFSLDNLDRRLHITNDQVQRLDSDYGKFEEGNKMSLADLKAYLAQTPFGAGGYDRIIAQMKAIVVDTTRAAAPMLNPRGIDHCFELFGFDFIVDASCRVWLLEVNTDPSLEVHSRHQSELIPALIDGVFALTVDRVAEGSPVDRSPASPEGSSMRWLHVYCSADDDTAGASGLVACNWVGPDA